MRSDNVTKGVQQAPHRSLMNALGMTEEEKNRPLIGIVNSYNEIVPGHMNLDKIQKRSSSALPMGGGTPGRIPGNRSLRWYRDGTCRHEIFPRNQRPDLRQHRVYGDGTSVRWSGMYP